MSVRLGKAIDRCARHQEIFEYSVFDYCHPSAFHALIIKSVIAEKFRPVDFLQCRIGIYGQEIRQHRLIYFFLEGLGFIFILLPLAFDAVAKNLVEENRARPTRKNRRTGVRFSQRGLVQGHKSLDHLVYIFKNRDFIRQAIGPH